MKRAVGDRIVIAGRQRMLAEGMAAKLCLKTMGIEDAAAQRELYTMWRIFGWYHQGMRQGNIQLDLSPELDPVVLRAWGQMDMVWGSLDGAYREVVDGREPDIGSFMTVMEMTDTVTDAASHQVAALRAAYADQLGPQGFGSALLIDLYERQRMLGQRITKDVCLVARGDTSPDRLSDMARTVQVFGLSLDAFQNGLADVGVPPPPSPEIAALLANARAEWLPAAPLAKAAAEGRALSDAELTEFALAMDRFIASMTGVINALIIHKTG